MFRNKVHTSLILNTRSPREQNSFRHHLHPSNSPPVLTLNIPPFDRHGDDLHKRVCAEGHAATGHYIWDKNTKATLECIVVSDKVAVGQVESEGVYDEDDC
jgi:hypothetical protein